MTAISFGVFVPQGWKMELASIPDPQQKWQTSVEIAQLAEQLGFDGVTANSLDTVSDLLMDMVGMMTSYLVYKRL
mgnify:CR=1 FL=1